MPIVHGSVKNPKILRCLKGISHERKVSISHCRQFLPGSFILDQAVKIFKLFKFCYISIKFVANTWARRQQ